MTNLFQKTVLTSLVASGLGVIALAPAQATGISNVSIGGTAPTDYLLYDANTTETFLNPNASLQSILSGNKNTPTGNIELAASSEKVGFDSSKSTTLKGTIGGRSLSVSSLTEADWNSTYQGTSFGQYWFSQALTSNGFGTLATSSVGTSLFNIFKTNGGFQRFSDPNISYINQNEASGDISIGLAGHYNASSLFTQSIDQYLASNNSLSTTQKLTLNGLKSQLSNQTLQASEVFKYEYNGLTNYGFSFQATQSGLTERSDQVSHTGNYEVLLKGPTPVVSQHVPEPGVMLSLLGFSGALAWKKRRGKEATA